uniref:AH domain-containing protein n=1 Tax=Megaselia scalaris TaxID=36166 RepID=T1GSX5_MEGSC
MTSIKGERSIHEMLNSHECPSMNESQSSILQETDLSGKQVRSQAVRTNLSLSAPCTPISAASPSIPQNGNNDFLRVGALKIDSLKNWSISTYKCTKQSILEKLGKSQRTVDSDLEAQIEQLRETQRKYLSILRLIRAFNSHFHHAVVTQHALAEAFSELAQKSPELQEEIEFDAYRMDLETMSPSQNLDETQQNFTRYKENYEKLRDDVTVKMQFLDENRIKVMHKQLILLHNAIAAYFSGNATALDNTLKQFNIKV